ncbi:MAG: hypothetical protein BGO14_02365 [Chlamydiales bacterium 38-26]|mgnify:CR=1 FL=1|nr:hypothetical protein [Chlamydiales bacterium]OJV08279.1 MAG: hypothetical protein BGO14_02365 [Chlamydiales bacterium 38-26]
MSQDLSNLNLGSGAQPVYQPTSVSSTESSTSPTASTSKDSIERASSVVAALYLPPMAFPMLTPPDPNNIEAITRLAMDKICLSILDSWSESLKKIADEKREEEKQKELNPLYKEIHFIGGLFFSISSIFLHAIFGTQAAEALQKAAGGADQKSVITNKLASQLSLWALDGVLSGYLMTIVDKLPSAANLNEGDKKVLANQIQVMLLSSALAALFKEMRLAKENWSSITAQDFISLLANPGQLNNPHATVLAALIVNTLQDLPEEARIRMARTLNIYMDDNPDLPTLLDLGESTDVQLSILHSTRT